MTVPLFPGTLVPYQLIRSRRRSLSVEIHPDGRLIVRIPARTPVSEAEQFLRSRAEWIATRLVRAAEQRQVIPSLTAPRQFHHRGAVFQWRMPTDSMNDGVAGTGLPDRQVVVPKRFAQDDATAWRWVEGWRRREAERVFGEMIGGMLPAFGVHGLRYRTLKIRRMRRRWGSCSSSGTITLNDMLVRTPDPCIRVVVIHELCHLVHLHHGPDFHALMRSMEPEYRKHDALLDTWSSVLTMPDPQTTDGARGPVEERYLWLGT